MKYSVDGLAKGKIIKSVDVIKQSKTDKRIKDSSFEETTVDVIVVNYLDGTQDVLKFDSNTLKNIEEVMIAQAESYVSRSSSNRIFYNISQFFCLLIALGGIGFALSSTGLLQLIVSIALIVGSGAMTLNLQLKKNDLKKYELFVQNAIYKVLEYKKIISNEANFIKNKSKKDPNFSGIRDLDNVSLKEINQVINKVDRYKDYKEVETKVQKVKSL